MSHITRVPRYALLAQHISDDIASGRFAVGERIPTEVELVERFGASRHTVRAAIRQLRELGLVTARAGIGTVVKSQVPLPRFLPTAGSKSDLERVTRETRMELVSWREVRADATLAARLGCKPQQAWLALDVLRFVPGMSEPIAHLKSYIRPEFASILPTIGDKPIFSLIESMHGVQIADVSQEITPVRVNAASARLLGVKPGTLALETARHYYEDGDVLVEVTIGVYPSGRFRDITRFSLRAAG